MIKGSTIRMRKRILLITLMMIFLFFSILIIRLINLQIINSHNLFKMANSQQLASTKLTARRGAIYDRNMVPLAQSATAWDVVLEPNYIKNDEAREVISQGLSEILDIPKEEIIEASKKRSSYKIIKKKINSYLKDKIIEFKSQKNITSGIRLIENYKRYNPCGTLASTVLGFTGDDGQGLAGLESYYDKILKGEDGKLVSAKNAIGTDMPYDYEHMIPPKDGQNLILTIDSNIQRIAERCLKQAVEKNDARDGGFIIAMSPKTGEILALAVENNFDPNNPFELCNQDKKVLEETPDEEKQKKKSELLSKQWRNTVVNSLYYPGSVFKIIVAAMGLELGLVDENSNFNCSGGIKISDRVIRCHKRIGHGPLNFVEALCKSCNPAFISLGQKIGSKNFFDFYKMFGFHEKTGIDLPGETKDVFFSEEGNMKPINLAVASIGQNFGITPIQMATAACAIANGGELVTPYIVKEIQDKDGKKSFSKKIKRQIISSETAKRVADMMAQNTICGGAKNAYVPGFRICGKTGTSEKKEKPLIPGQKEYMSSYCGFAPVDNPQLLVLMGVNNPQGGQYYGSIVVAPNCGLFFSEALPCVGIQPQYNEEESKKYGIEIPNLVGKKISEAKTNIIDLDLKPFVIGAGSEVLSQVPSPGNLIARGGTIIIYTENNTEGSENNKVKVPNFIGMKKSEAAKIAESAGLNISVSGSSDENDIIKTQSPSGSEYVPKGTTINVVIHNDNLID